MQTRQPATYGNFINGEWSAAASGATYESRSPANANDLVGSFASSDVTDLDQAITAAEAAAPLWRGTSPIARANILFKAADILTSRLTETGRELAWEEGKTAKEGIGETGRAAQILRYFAGDVQQPDGEHYPSANPSTLLYTVKEPLGPVGIITPWNFPIAIPAWKIAPALAYGNTVVFKPASLTPLLAVRLVEALAEAGLPAGVLNLVTGSSSKLGDPMVDDPRLTAISFTGSGTVGRRISQRAAERGAKVQLELGGKNPAIVTAEADVEHALTHVVNGAMMSTGQKCTATSRAIVDRAILQEFSEKLVARVEQLVVGDPLDDRTQMGPVVSEDALVGILDDCERGESEGARLISGGSRLTSEGRENGHFMAPTVFADVKSDTYLGQEELFGPVLGIIEVDGLDEAIAVANSVRYGLSASLFTRDLAKAMTFVNHIQAGVVHVNSETAGAEPQVPFGGYKGSSSYSREQGKSARDFYTQIKTVYIDLPPS